MKSAPVSLNFKEVRAKLKPRPLEAHKNLFGHVFVIGGDYGMAGAALLAAKAALTVGAGKVTLCTRPEYALQAFVAVPELMTLSLNTIDILKNNLSKATAIVLGPGLGQKEWGRDLFETVLSHAPDCPLLMDADALNLLSSKPLARQNWILTPHPGEAGRLLGCSTESIQKNRENSIKELQHRFQGTIVLKGQGTLILGEDTQITRCDQGNPGMATAGMGDILSGLIIGLVAQGMSNLDASCLGVAVHALAADKLAEEQGEHGLLPTEVLQRVPACLKV